MTHSDYVDVEEGEKFENTKGVTRSHKSKNTTIQQLKEEGQTIIKKKRRKINIQQCDP